jgi:predicted ATP-binding protein involved in virulence
LEDLGYGYQATLAWVADLAKRMFDQYPDLENPLHGPAVVLVDEIDLHLHPEWQRKIIKYLSDLFPNTQFIVTAHSPLIIQSAENVNIIMLEKDDNPEGKGINIRQRFGSFQGWTVDEILTELMNLGDRTRSDLYLQLMQDFENAVLDDDYEKAQNAYNQLDTILSPSSYQRKVLQIQMSSLIPVGV